MALTSGGRRYEPAGHPAGPQDDYFVDTGAKPLRPPIWLQLNRFLQFILVIAITILSFAVFWMVGLIIGAF